MNGRSEESLIDLHNIVSDPFLRILSAWSDSIKTYEVSKFDETALSFSESERHFLRELGPECADLLVALRILDHSFNLVVPAIFGASNLENFEGQFSLQSRPALSLSFFIREVLNAFLLCAWDGRDTPARILARTISEAFDVLVLVSFDKKASDDYAESGNDPEGFYRKHIARGGLPRRRKELLTELLGAAASDEVEAYAGSEFHAFSQAVHPSYTAGVTLLLASFPGRDDDPFSFLTKWPCRRVVRYVVYSMSLSLAVVSRHGKEAISTSTDDLSSLWNIIESSASLGLLVSTNTLGAVQEGTQ